MSLLNGLLAFGAAAFAIPLLIHLLHRSRFKTVAWGAMYLLEPIVRVNRRRMRWSNLLLLLIRCSLPIVLALCLARPVLTSFQSASPDDPESIVLVIDDSLSMTTVDDSQVSRINRLRQSLGKVFFSIDQSQRDEVIWMPTSQADLTPSSMSISAAMAKANEMQATGGPFDFSNLIRRAVAAANSGSYPHRRIVIASDFQEVNFSGSAIESLRSFVNSSKKDAALPLDWPRIQFWNVASGEKLPKNLSIDLIDSIAPAVVPLRETELTATIHSNVDQEISDLRVMWSINGERLESTLVNVPVQGTAMSRIRYRFPKAVAYEVVVAIDPESIEMEDQLTADNTRSMTLQVIEPIEVLLIDGEPSRQAMESETDFLAIALSPFTFSATEEIDSINTEVTNSDGLLDELAKNRTDILVLANVSSLSAQAQDKIAEFVDSGGSLILFDGQNLGTANYRSGFEQAQSTMPLPALPGEMVGEVRGLAGTDLAATPMRIETENSDKHSLWGDLATSGDSPLREVDIYAYRKLQIPAAAETSVLLSMQNGDPLIVSAKRGQGKIVQFAIPADAAWTSLPLRVAFVPLIQQLVFSLAAPSRVLPDDDGQIPASESQLQSAEPQTIQAAAELLGASVHNDPDSVYGLQQEERFGREIWKSLLLLLLVLMVAELVVQQWSTGVTAR